MPKFDLLDDITQAIKDRSNWELRQTTWYQMRHGGVRRSSLPYPNAPDLHFPLVDSLIDKAKPFYVQQLYAAQTFASFVSLKQQSGELTSDVGSWFDFKLKQKSNFEREAISWVDYMLGAGGAVIKMYWDEDAKELCFDARDPLYIIVPRSTIDITDADYMVDVIHMSEEQYKRNPKFNQDKDFIKKITGKDTTATGSLTKYQEVCRREGLTMGQNDNQIIIWEVYKRNSSSVSIQTISPLQPFEDMKVRDDFNLPYNLGIFKRGNRFPYARSVYEIKDKGWYASRGIPEIVAAFETSMCRMWNSKHEAMDFYNKPTFSSDGTYEGTTSNIRMLPGQILPKGVTPTENPSPPISYDQEMQSTRATAEYRLQIPDLGSNQTAHLSGSPGYGGEKPTASQVNAIVGQSGQADDLRARQFRLDLGEVYQMAYAIYLQFDKASLYYVLGGELTKLDSTALHDSYLISPNGSADSWNRGLQMQKAVQRKQMYTNDPFIDQGELDKSCLELDDPGLIKRLYRDPGLKQQDEIEEQSLETLLMLNNFGAPVHPTDDDKTHLQALAQFGQQRMQEGQPITPLQAQLFKIHIAGNGQSPGHIQQLAQKKDKMLGQILKMMKPFLDILDQLIAQGQPQQAGNVVPMQPQQQGAKSAMSSKQPDPQKNAAALMNAFAALEKAGQPVGVDQINAALAQAGMPPIQIQPMQPQPAA